MSQAKSQYQKLLNLLLLLGCFWLLVGNGISLFAGIKLPLIAGETYLQIFNVILFSIGSFSISKSLLSEKVKDNKLEDIFAWLAIFVYLFVDPMLQLTERLLQEETISSILEQSPDIIGKTFCFILSVILLITRYRQNKTNSEVTLPRE